MRKLILPLLIFITQFGFSTGNLFQEINSLQKTQVSSLDGLSIKYVPAFYWSTVGIQAEYPVTFKFSAGANLLFSLGDEATTGALQAPSSSGGFAVDLFTKYYFADNAPEGLYAYANLSYNSLFYFDGNNRPYTIHSHWKNEDGNFNVPTKLNGGIGAGYQVKILRHLIGDVLTGVQLQSGTDGFYYSIYVMPSIGYVF